MTIPCKAVCVPRPPACRRRGRLWTGSDTVTIRRLAAPVAYDAALRTARVGAAAHGATTTRPHSTWRALLIETTAQQRLSFLSGSAATVSHGRKNHSTLAASPSAVGSRYRVAKTGACVIEKTLPTGDDED